MVISCLTDELLFLKKDSTRLSYLGVYLHAVIFLLYTSFAASSSNVRIGTRDGRRCVFS